MIGEKELAKLFSKTSNLFEFEIREMLFNNFSLFLISEFNNSNLSLNSKTESGTDVIIANWVDVGRDSSYTFTGLNLVSTKRYYFSVKGRDALGNFSNIAVSDGFVIDLVGPIVTGISVPQDQLLPIYQNASIDVTVSEQLSGANIQFSSAQGDLLNIDPSYKIEVIPKIKGRKYYLCLPKNKMGVFVANEKQIYNHFISLHNEKQKLYPKYSEEEKRIIHKVKSGEYLGKIALRYGCSVKKIQKWNNLKNDQIRSGQ